jgi:arabinogalactan oligomer/maltooligosaccharide transport system permease protein
MKDESKSMPFYVWIPLGIWDTLVAFAKSVFGFIYSITVSILTFFYRFGKGLIRFFVLVYKMFAHYVDVFIKGDRHTKLSYLIMGWGAFIHKQYVKGIGYFVLQVGIITSIFTVFWKYLIKFTTLGTDLTTPAGFDEVCNCYVPATEGDNSMLVLLFSIAAILLLFGLFYLYTLNIETAYKNQLIWNKNKVNILSQEKKKRLLILASNYEFFCEKIKLWDSSFYYSLKEKLESNYEINKKIIDLEFEVKNIKVNERYKIIRKKSEIKNLSSLSSNIFKEILNYPQYKLFISNKIQREIKRIPNFISVRYKIYNNLKNKLKLINLDLKPLLPQGFKKDADELLNHRFHVTVLTFPTIFAFTFTVLPLIFMILLAFTNFDRFHQPPGTLFTWVGLDNFMAMFSGQTGYYRFLPGTLVAILRWSFIWAFFATFLNYFFGIILALMINKKGIRLKKLWRTAFVITIAVPQFISLLVINFFLNDLGPLKNFFVEMGWVGQGFSFLGIAENARITVIIVNLWVGVPYTMLMTSGILMNIPQDLYESATIDGAGTITKFFKITMPYMFFVTGPSLLTAFIGNINSFGVIYFLTGGGPSSQTLFQAGETDLLVTWLFKLTLFEQDYKMASTLGIIIFIISSFISLIMFSKIKGVKDEEAFQ